MSWPTTVPDHAGVVVCALRGWTTVSVPASIPRCNDASNATIEPRIEAVERKQSKAQQLLYERIIDRAQGGNAPTVELFGWHNPAAPSPPVTAQQIEIHVHAHCTLGHQMATTQNPTDLH